MHLNMLSPYTKKTIFVSLNFRCDNNVNHNGAGASIIICEDGPFTM